MTEVHARVKPRRSITAMSAVLLPFTAAGDIDWPYFEAHLARTVDAGIEPAVNMDTGFGPVLDPADRTRILQVAAANVPGRWVGGAHVADAPGAVYDGDAYARECDEIAVVRWDADPLPVVRDGRARRRRPRRGSHDARRAR